MPKRIIDGDRLWTSEKLRAVEPEAYRAEYANLIPLALANGSFECEPIRVQRDVYFYLRPSLTLSDITSILNEYERVRLLFRWKDESGKTWGYWVGIEADGLLPSDSKMKHYKKGEKPPLDLLQAFLRGEIDSGLCENNVRTLGEQGADDVPQGLDRIGIGLGIGLDDKNSEENNQEKDGQEEMKAEKEIVRLCQNLLGVSVKIWDTDRNDLRRLESLHKGSAVARAFEEWASGKEDTPAAPVRAFLREADGILSGESPLAKASKSPAVVGLARELTYLSDGKVAFGDRQKPVLTDLLADYSQSEICAVFKTWLEDQDLSDPKNLAFAAKNFVERADALCYSAQKKKQERVAAESDREAAKERLQAEAEEERLRSEEEKQKEELIFDPLA